MRRMLSQSLSDVRALGRGKTSMTPSPQNKRRVMMASTNSLGSTFKYEVGIGGSGAMVVRLYCCTLR